MTKRILLFLIIFLIFGSAGAESQTPAESQVPVEPIAKQETGQAAEPVAEPSLQQEIQAAIVEVKQLPEQVKDDKENYVTLDFKDADIQNVLRVLAYKSGVNIVSGKEVTGTVTIRLVDVPWEQALAVILNTYGFAYEREGNIITVSTVEALKERREKMKELTDIEGVTSKVFSLQFLDAVDAKKMLEPQLSSQGKISVLEITGQKGWKVGVPIAGGQTTEQGKERRERENARSHSLVITDTPTYLERIAKIIKDIDVKPNQVLIEARIMEVNRDVLRDLGVEWSTGNRLQTHAGRTNATTGNLVGTVAVGADHHKGVMTGRVYSQTEANDPSGYLPSNFSPLATNLSPANAGLELLYDRLIGKQVEIMVHALEEDVRTNTLSSPKILTLSGQEALILIGEKYPIVETQISGTAGTTSTTLAYYQDIGIQLYVVPQISGDEKFINMIIHPVISSETGLLTDAAGTYSYPILATREAETQVVMSDGETIVIGGLLRDVKSKSKIGLPVLGSLPIIGSLFTRQTNDTEKIDLLIFITARIIKPGEFTDQELAMIKQAVDAGQPTIAPEQPKKEKEKKESKKGKSGATSPIEGYSKGNSNKGNKGYINKK